MPTTDPVALRTGAVTLTTRGRLGPITANEESTPNMTRKEWIEAFAREIGMSPPGQDQVDALLELAGTAAHASERTAAPVAAWLAGSSGKSLDVANEAARRISDTE